MNRADNTNAKGPAMNRADHAPDVAIYLAYHKNSQRLALLQCMNFMVMLLLIKPMTVESYMFTVKNYFLFLMGKLKQLMLKAVTK